MGRIDGYDMIRSAENPVSHWEDSPWWQVSQQMNGPELRERFNKTLLPALDKNKDGHLSEGELWLGMNVNPLKGRDADAVKILHDYFSFFLDFRGGMTPGYHQALHGETLGLYAEFEKTIKPFNQAIHRNADYVLANFDAFDTNKDDSISDEELKAKTNSTVAGEKQAAQFFLHHYWGVHNLVQNEGSGDGFGRRAMIDLKQRRSPMPELLAAPRAEADDPNVNEPIRFAPGLADSRTPNSDRRPDPRTSIAPMANQMRPPRSEGELISPPRAPWLQSTEERNPRGQHPDASADPVRPEPVEREDPPRHRHYRQGDDEPAVVPPRSAPGEPNPNPSDNGAENTRERVYKGIGKSPKVEREDPKTVTEWIREQYRRLVGR